MAGDGSACLPYTLLLRWVHHNASSELSTPAVSEDPSVPRQALRPPSPMMLLFCGISKAMYKLAPDFFVFLELDDFL